jgi:hypothetical protein
MRKLKKNLLLLILWGGEVGQGYEDPYGQGRITITDR